MTSESKSSKSRSEVSLLTAIGSVLASAFGVQSGKNYQRDVAHGSLKTYIVIGVVFVTLFVLGLYALVQWVIGQA